MTLVDSPSAHTHPVAETPVVEPPWYETNDPALVVEWARDYIVKDLESLADGLRRKADLIDGKACLLFDMMDAVSVRLAAISAAEQVGTPQGVNQNKVTP